MDISQLLTRFRLPEIDREDIFGLFKAWALTFAPLLFFANIIVFSNGELTMEEVITIMTVIFVVLLSIWAVGLVLIFTDKLIGFKFYIILKKGFLNNNIDNVENIEILASSNQDIKHRHIRNALAILYKKISIGEEKQLQDQIDTLLDIINFYKKKDPLSNIPKNLRYVIKNIQEHGGNSIDSQYLISQLEELFSDERKRIRKQYLVTVGSLALGALAVALTIYSLL